MAKRKSPFEITASMMTLTDFELSHPLCEVRSEGRIDKFVSDAEVDPSGKLLKINGVDKGLLDYFLVRHLYPVMEKAGSCYINKSNENKFRAVASAFFPIFTHLAPQQSDEEMLKQYESGDPSTDAVTGLEVHDAHTTSRTPQVDALDGQSRETLEFVQEDGADLGPRQVVDFRGYAGKRVKRRWRTVKQSVTVLICDAKQKNFIWKPNMEEDSVLYQLSDYSCCAGVANMRQGRYKPIHMVVLADGDYAIAVLHMEGYLSVDRGGKITSESFSHFLGQLREKWCQENSGSIYVELSDTEKETRLKAYQEQLDETRERMREADMVDTIPMGRKLIVGKVLFFPLTRSWTKFPIAFSAQRFTVDDYVFVSGMLRVLYGDRVCVWTRETLEALAKAHDDRLEARGKHLAMPS